MSVFEIILLIPNLVVEFILTSTNTHIDLLYRMYVCVRSLERAVTLKNFYLKSADFAVRAR